MMLDFFSPHPPPLESTRLQLKTVDYATRAVCRIYLGENKLFLELKDERKELITFLSLMLPHLCVIKRDAVLRGPYFGGSKTFYLFFRISACLLPGLNYILRLG